MSDAGESTDGPTPCRSAADCDDGLFCTGDERCAPSAPDADARGCAPPTRSACLPGQTCDETADTCVTDCGTEVDADGDGVDALSCGGLDCDDADAMRFPGNAEVCDPADHDEDCDTSTYGARDLDGDGHNDAACCNAGSTGAPVCGDDCDDAAADVYTGLVEACDGVDNDCDTSTDEGVLRLFYPDMDGDSFGDSGAASVQACTPPSFYSETGGDCDDTVADVNPSAAERCNNRDDNCTGAADEGLAVVTVYVDADGDGHAGTPQSHCAGYPGTEPSSRDCNETDSTIYLGAAELCDRRDDDCSMGGGVDVAEDPDNDGYMPAGVACSGGTLQAGDCNESALNGASDHPTASDVCDTRDNDCDGVVDEDPTADASCAGVADGYAGCSAGACVLVGCAPHFADCDLDDATGCEIDTRRSSAHCGGCGLECGGGAPCVDGVCERIVEVEPGGNTMIGGGTCFRYSGGSVSCVGGDAVVPEPVPGLAGATALSTNDNWHRCVVRSDGTVACWGANPRGELGTGSLTPSGSTAALTVASLTDAVEVDTGQLFSCARRATGGVVCWGDNMSGQLGDGTTTARSAPVSVLLPPGWSAYDIAVGSAFACAALANGAMRAVYCWGENSSGQLGRGATSSGPNSTPAPVVGVTAVTGLVAAYQSACVLDAAGRPLCWGDNSSGQLGDGSTSPALSPALVTGGLTGMTLIAAGTAHVCVASSTTTPQCWGLGVALGDGGVDAFATAPRAVVGMTGPGTVALTAATTHACALDTGGEVYCWGTNSEGELGDGTRIDRRVATRALVRSSRGVAVGRSNFSCAVRGTGEVDCWGYNAQGELGRGTTSTREVARAAVVSITDAVQIASGFRTTCARRATGALMCWGANPSGTVGDGSTVDRPTPVLVLGIGAVIDVDVDESHACAVGVDGTLACWGTSGTGAIGDGTTMARLAPVTVSLPSPATGVSLGSSSTCATTRSGQLYCWGRGASGELGTGDRASSLVPIPVPGMIDVVEVDLGAGSACARRADGDVYCWGSNASGEIGDGTRTDRPSPVRIGALSSATLGAGRRVAALSLGNGSSCALLTDGSLRCWGEGSAGQLGDGASLDRLTPVTVATYMDFRAISDGGGVHRCASRGPFGVACWGSNAAGEIGDGSPPTARPLPTAVLGLP